MQSLKFEGCSNRRTSWFNFLNFFLRRNKKFFASFSFLFFEWFHDISKFDFCSWWNLIVWSRANLRIRRSIVVPLILENFNAVFSFLLKNDNFAFLGYMLRIKVQLDGAVEVLELLIALNYRLMLLPIVQLLSFRALFKLYRSLARKKHIRVFIASLRHGRRFS